MAAMSGRLSGAIPFNSLKPFDRQAEKRRPIGDDLTSGGGEEKGVGLGQKVQLASTENRTACSRIDSRSNPLQRRAQ